MISGRFRTATQTDWALLCSRNQVSSILVFWGSSTRSVDELGEAPDRRFLQAMGAEGVVFSRILSVASPARIRRYYADSGGPKPPVLDHDGIDDYFAGKASVVRYRHAGRWLKLPGAD